MRAVITVSGSDGVGIIARVSSLLYSNGINIADISQTVYNGMFLMVMVVDLLEKENEFSDLSNKLKRLGEEIGQKINIRHEKVFNSMHRI